MAIRLLFSPLAQLDLDAIWDHSVDHWGMERTERYFRQLWKYAEDLAAPPLAGQSCDDVREGYRKYRAGSHILFYRFVGDKVEIVRILHERMDYQRYL